MISNIQTTIIGAGLVMVNTVMPTPPTVWSLVGLIIAAMLHWTFVWKEPVASIVAVVVGIVLLPVVELGTGADWLKYCEIVVPLIIFRFAYLLIEQDFFQKILAHSRHYGRIFRL